LKFGFAVRLLMDAVKGVDIKKGDSKNAIQEMTENGAQRITLEELAKGF